MQRQVTGILPPVFGRTLRVCFGRGVRVHQTLCMSAALSKQPLRCKSAKFPNRVRMVMGRAFCSWLSGELLTGNWAACSCLTGLDDCEDPLAPGFVPVELKISGSAMYFASLSVICSGRVTHQFA